MGLRPPGRPPARSQDHRDEPAGSAHRVRRRAGGPGLMTKISGSTFYFKKVFPAIWFGFLAFFLVTAVPAAGGEAPLFLIVPVVMAIFGYVLFKKLVWDLADEVLDAGDRLVFRKGGQEQVVRLEDVINISHTPLHSPERITLHLRTPGPLGKELVFNPPLRKNPFSKCPLFYELMERVDKARRK